MKIRIEFVTAMKRTKWEYDIPTPPNLTSEQNHEFAEECVKALSDIIENNIDYIKGLTNEMRSKK